MRKRMLKFHKLYSLTRFAIDNQNTMIFLTFHTGKANRCSKHTKQVFILVHFDKSQILANCAVSSCAPFDFISHGVCLRLYLHRAINDYRSTLITFCQRFYFKTLRITWSDILKLEMNISWLSSILLSWWYFWWFLPLSHGVSGETL